MTSSRYTIGLFSTVIFISAFLLFQVQPMLSKQLLPWFGGSPSVWTTAMLFFQSVLCAGYIYAHLLSRRLSRSGQARVHLALLALAAALAWQVLPGADSQPQNPDTPVTQVLSILALSVGIPYFCLSTTGPLLQHWFSHTPHAGSVYRLYALSNLGSFLALLSFPYVFEPWLELRQMASIWSWGFVVFVVLCAPIAWGRWQSSRPATAGASPSGPGNGQAAAEEASATASAGSVRWAWWGLPALASLMFIAVTDQISHDVAPEPKIWISTLGLYLLSFVLTFDNPRWYRPRLFAALALIAILVTCGRSDWPRWLGFNWDYSATEMRWMHYLLLFSVCMLCHGELYRRRPRNPARLTEFYLWMSLGGAFGGLFVTLIATHAFNDYHEWPATLVLSMLLALTVWLRPAAQRPRVWHGLLAVGLVALLLYHEDPWNLRTPLPDGVQETRLDHGRNFYGTIAVKERRHATQPERDERIFLSGQITHGQQYLHQDLRRVPSTYYAQDSGIGETFAWLMQRKPSLEVALVGLGAGTLANYARPGDRYDFYEINPEVVRIAETWFDNLEAFKGEKRILVGDARLRMAQLPADKTYDLIVLDAFTGGSVPSHLLTSEAFAIYRRHLKADGAIAANITNAFINLYPVLRIHAEDLGMGWRNKHQEPDSRRRVRRNEHFIMTSDRGYLDAHPSVPRLVRGLNGEAASPENLDWAGIRRWTDQYSSLQSLEWR